MACRASLWRPGRCERRLLKFSCPFFNDATDAVGQHARIERAAALRETAGAHRTAWLASQIGTRQRILVERPGDRGHAGNFAEVRLRHPLIIGEIADVTITDSENGFLIGESA
mgnify:CR=1 FL=1